ncbi:mitogen-activated protein (MAP) kinase kinase kinase, MLK1/MLK2/MLK4 [Artemisia annua]|uniref:Mitogen-activated protein (MAP) kinase kinase kinase, MLK1/MLK2/MLK4 n=1 Tax=Artemisia annua TaxID=35608 RepID=A0A2U1PXT2_ARTAN|nr:mitogen-activated protein (MAP) kinase kinase kinase, MLK1/MLK2/MLK4 [Artemisia annua]
MMLPGHINDTGSSFILPELTCQRFTLDEIQLATRNFDDALVIGRGGFGKVYRCRLKIGSVRQVAVKRLHSMSNQGAHEFEVEVQILSKLRHGNLVPLIGYCIEGKDMCLVYEFMPNGTLEDHLHKDDTELSWLQRLNICIGAARGLDYLHTGTSTQHGVIHRDVKSSNILLDAKFDAKISDFGLAKVGPINQTRTYVRTGVKGTFGYMDPYYFNSGKLTRKSDVYAFGVVLFEVLCGKQAVDPSLDEEQWSLAAWAQDQIKVGKLNQIIDSRLMGKISKKSLKEFARIACHCLHDQPKQRPTMAEVVVRLDLILLRERESAEAGVDEGRFINRFRYLFTGKADLIPARAVISESNSQPFIYGGLDSATYTLDYEEFHKRSLETIYKGWADDGTHAPTECGFSLAMRVKKRYIGKSELDFKPEEFHHPNLVKLLGYCLNEQELSCAYEILSDTSLDKLLFGGPGTSSLSWVARLKIAVGAANGLSFLHQRRNPAYTQFKTTCILVDMDYNARLWDFEVENSFVALGSYSFQNDAPYAAPEWFRYQADAKFDGICDITINNHGENGFGVKSEIYAFGVVLLELLTGMKAYDNNRPYVKKKLVKWAIPLLTDEEELGKIIDPQLQHESFLPKGAYKLASLVSKCLHPSQEKRPPMEEIYQVLNHCYIEETKNV